MTAKYINPVDVGTTNPELTRARSGEDASDWIGRGLGVLVAPGRNWVLTSAAGTNQARVAHQESDAFTTMLLTSLKLGVNTRCAIQLKRDCMHGPDPLKQRGIGLRVGQCRTLRPGIEAGFRDAEHARHGGDGNLAWFALMSRKIRAARRRFRGELGWRLIENIALQCSCLLSRRSRVSSLRLSAVIADIMHPG